MNNKNELLEFLDGFDGFVTKIITIHDYQWLFSDNPNILYSDFNKMIGYVENDIIIWLNELFNRCDKIIFPDNSVYINYNKFICLNNYNNKINIVNHCDKIINYDNFYVSDISCLGSELGNINIAFLGNFCQYKGRDEFIEIANYIQEYKEYKIKYHVFGENSGFGNCDNIIIHNKYNDIEIIDLLYKNNIHGIVHLSQFEETYCYALTNSINSGLPILYNNIGAFKNRLASKHERFISLNDNDDQINDRILYFFDYIIQKKGIKNINISSSHIQPNKWYLENY